MSDTWAAPFIGIVRHRLATDGKGVTTLVAFHDCPLRCKYCLNEQCHDSQRVAHTLTPQQLVDRLLIDNLYFLATGGGVCFGGGEPLLHSEFIAKFCSVKIPEWKVTLETSLHVPLGNLQRVSPYIDHYVIDIKDCNPDIYHNYTGGQLSIVLDNLRWLVSQKDTADHIVVRLPHIPNHNTIEDVARSKDLLTTLGITQFDEFEYIIPANEQTSKQANKQTSKRANEQTSHEQ